MNVMCAKKDLQIQAIACITKEPIQILLNVMFARGDFQKPSIYLTIKQFILEKSPMNVVLARKNSPILVH
jgi:hypothetical protein